MKRWMLLTAVCLVATTLCAQREKIARTITVAQDGSGDVRTIQAALDSIAPDNKEWTMVYVRPGVYGEKLYIKAGHVILAGESREWTRIVYGELRSQWRAEHKDSDWGAATINIADETSDVVLANLTIINNYGALNNGDNGHQFAIRSSGPGSRVALLHVAAIAFGGDTVSLWNARDGMSFYYDSYFEGFVDFLCPRGSAYAVGDSFYAHRASAAIWHDAGESESNAFAITHSYFDGVSGFALGRHHREAKMALLGNRFSPHMGDREIFHAGDLKLKFGERIGYVDDHREGGDYAWHTDNIDAKRVSEIDMQHIFGGAWRPDQTLPSILPQPAMPWPENGARNVASGEQMLRWTSARKMHHQKIYFGESANPPLLASNDGETQKVALKPATTYYWHVESDGEKGATPGATWSFTTAGAKSDAPTMRALPTGRKIRIALAGDSTVTEGQGWGLGFAAKMGAAVEVINIAKGGRSSRSYINEGWWKKILESTPDYVLIQFGHNDVIGKSADRETQPWGMYRESLQKMIDDARAIGAVPVIVTSLAQRSFEGDKLRSGLYDYAQAARQLAVENRVAVIDLNEYSSEMLRAMGKEKAAEFDPLKPDGSHDGTHLNEKGRAVFGALVAHELRVAAPELKSLIKP